MGRRLLAGAASSVVVALALAACSSSGGHPAAATTRAVWEFGSSGAVPGTPGPTASAAAPTASMAGTAPAGTAPAGTAPAGPAPTGSSTAVTGPRTSSNPTVVDTGTVAPYSTPAREPSLPPDQSGALGAVPGTSSPSCASVGDQAVLRAGSVAVGDFAAARSRYRQVVATTEVPQVSLYIIPRHTAGLRSASITIDPLGRGRTREVTTRSVHEGETARYLPVSIPVAAPGRYRLSVAAGSDRGCYLVTFTR